MFQKFLFMYLFIYYLVLYRNLPYKNMAHTAASSLAWDFCIRIASSSKTTSLLHPLLYHKSKTTEACIHWKVKLV